MKRIRQTILYLALSLLMLFGMVRQSELYLSPESALASHERGLHYGPSKQILLRVPGEDDTLVMVSRAEKDTFFSIVLQRRLGIFWRARPGFSGTVRSLSPEPVLAIYYGASMGGVLLGMTNIPGAVQVRCTLWDSWYPVYLEACTMPIDENGIFSCTGLPIATFVSTNRTDDFIFYDADGNIIPTE